MKNAFRVCGIGTEDIPVCVLNSTLHRLLTQLSYQPDDFEEDVFLDDEDAFELDEDAEHQDDSDDDSAEDATGADIGDSLGSNEV